MSCSRRQRTLALAALMMVAGTARAQSAPEGESQSEDASAEPQPHRRVSAGRAAAEATAATVVVVEGGATTTEIESHAPYVRPAVSVVGIYDDNLFATPDDPTRAAITRVGPRIEFGLPASAWRLRARYAINGEHVHGHQEEALAVARQEAAGDLTVRPLRTLRLGAGIGYVDTPSTVDLDPLVAVDLGRVHATRLSMGPSVSWQLDSRSTFGGSYLFARDAVDDVETDTHAVDTAFARWLLRHGQGRIGVRYRHFVFGSGTWVDSVTPMPGWLHRLTRRLTLEVAAGPRFSPGETTDVEDIEADAAIRWARSHTSVGLTYARVQGPLPGGRATAVTNAAAIPFMHTFRMGLTVMATPGVGHTRGPGLEAVQLRGDLSVAFPVTRWLWLVAASRSSWLRQRVEPVPPTSTMPMATSVATDVPHQVILAGVDLRTPQPLRGGP